MKNWLLLAAAILVVGCSDSGSEPTTSPIPPSPSASATLTVPPTSSETASPSESASPSASATPVVQRGTTGGNLKRVYQLKDLTQIPLTIGKAHVKVWIMNTADKRAEGMMWLTDKEVKDTEGMLFVFYVAQPLSFWMHNTILPLDIIYIGANKKVVSIVHGKAQDDTSLPTGSDCQYVVELKSGMSAKLGIKAGDAVGIPDNVKSLDQAP